MAPTRCGAIPVKMVKACFSGKYGGELYEKSPKQAVWLTILGPPTQGSARHDGTGVTYAKLAMP